MQGNGNFGLFTQVQGVEEARETCVSSDSFTQY